ncbi:unnamed protein product [Prunus armeniaca]
MSQRDSLANDERLNALEGEVRLLWAASRKYNFDLHVLEFKAQDAEDRLETVASQAQKMADIVTEQWIQIQRLGQALHITQNNGFKFSALSRLFILHNGAIGCSYVFVRSKAPRG